MAVSGQSASANVGSFHVVGIGASAGGLEALETFCAHIPPELNCAFVVVTHLDPTHKSMMSELLSRHTSLQVKQIENGDKIKPGSIYMIPPNRELGIEKGRLLTIEHAQPRGFRTPINTFFNHLAREYKERAIGVILSGSGTDGADALEKIKANGGLVLVQRPEDARYSGMPNSAIGSGAVDVVESAQALPELILRHARKELIKSKYQPKIDPVDAAVEATDKEFKEIFDLLKNTVGHDFYSYKRATLQRRLARRVDATKSDNVAMYIQHLQENEEELNALFNEFLINVTRFFRDSSSFKVLETQVIPALVDRIASSNPLRIWIAGCSTGEEAYSIAMLIAEQAANVGKPLNVNMFATDIDNDALSTARSGYFSATQIESQIDSDRIAKYFTRHEGNYKISKSIRDLVVFSQHDLTRNPPLSKVDMVVCRNVMIYLGQEAQQKTFSMFHYALKPDSYLFLGPSESLGNYDRYFEPVTKKEKIYKKNTLDAPAMSKYHVSIPQSRERQPGTRAQKRDKPSIEELANAFFIQEDLKPTAIIDTNNVVIHFAGDVEKFFKLSKGSPSFDLFSLVDQKIHTEIRATVYSVAKNRKPVRFNRIRIGHDGILVNLVARPLIIGESDSTYTALTFEEVDEEDLKLVGEDEGESLENNVPEEIMKVVKAQTEELQKTKLILKNVVRDADTTYQELSSANEELMSTNEELQSTTQELETSREELQSLNEELETVNAELRRKVDDLTSANDDMNNLMAATQIGTLFLDQALQVKSFTPAVTSFFNLISGDVGRPINHISHGLVDFDLMSCLSEVTGTLTLVEKEATAEDGRQIIIRVLPYRTADNKIDGVVVTFFDTTNLHIAKQALEQSERRLNALLNAIPDAFVMVSSEGVVLDYRVGSGGLTLARDKIVGKSIESLPSVECFLDQSDLAKVSKAVKKVLRNQDVDEIEVSVTPPGETTKIVEVRIASGGPDFAVCVFRDVTDRREAEYLKVAKDTAEKVSTAKSEFIANMSHELRTPLNGILGFAEILKVGLTGDLTAKQSEYVENIYKSGKQLLTLVNEILDLAKTESEGLTLEESEVCLNSVVQEVVKSCEPLHTNDGIEVDCQKLDESIVIWGDRRRLWQVLLNLLGNAIKYTGKGGRVEFQSHISKDGEVILKVADNGIGIPVADLERVFGRFEQVTDKSRPSKGGTGIGLALVRKIVELHDGKVQASLPGLDERGVSFTITFPPKRCLT